MKIYTKRKGVLVKLSTNGILITPQITEYLISWRPFSIEITLYGHTKETYERVIGISGSYERCMEKIHLLIVRGLPSRLKTTAVTLNKNEIGDMKRFTEEALELGLRFDAIINPRGACSQRPLDVRLTPAEVVALDLWEPRRVPEWKKLNTRLGVEPYLTEKNEIYSGNAAGN